MLKFALGLTGGNCSSRFCGNGIPKSDRFIGNTAQRYDNDKYDYGENNAVFYRSSCGLILENSCSYRSDSHEEPYTSPEHLRECHWGVNEFLRGASKLENSFTPLVVVAVALHRADGRVLMQQRPRASMHGGLWEFPGGKVDPGETPEEAAVRELEEELGVAIDRPALTPVGFASGRTGDGARALVILLYVCREWRGEPQPHEAEALDWLEPEAIQTLAMPPLDYPLANALCKFLHPSAI